MDKDSVKCCQLIYRKMCMENIGLSAECTLHKFKNKWKRKVKEQLANIVLLGKWLFIFKTKKNFVVPA